LVVVAERGAEDFGRAAIVVGPDDDAIAQRFFPFLALDELPAAGQRRGPNRAICRRCCCTALR